MAFVPPLGYPPERVKELLAPLRSGVSIALHRAGNAFAVGACIRVAHSFLVREVLLVGDAPYYAKASMGMERYETIVELQDDDALLAHVAGRPMWAIEKDVPSDRAVVGLYDLDTFPTDVVLVFGSERSGISQAILDRVQRVVAIPMYGVNHSFPLTVTVGMVLGEWARRKYFVR
jgi:tRNA G18 (ribose-2'-O)-methylase SpoU